MGRGDKYLLKINFSFKQIKYLYLFNISKIEYGMERKE